jgi:hypothetical protein
MPNVFLRTHADRRHPVAVAARAALYGTATIALIAAMPTSAGADDMTELKVELQELLDRMERVEQVQDQSQVAAEQATGSSYVVNRSIRNRATKQTDFMTLQDMYITPQTAQEDGVMGGDFPGSFKLPGSDTSMAIFGFAKADYIYNFGAKRAFPFAQLGTFQAIETGAGITAGGVGDTHGNDGDFNMSVQTSQVSIMTQTPSEYGTITTHLKWDFGAINFNEGEGPGAGEARVANYMELGARLMYGTIGPLTFGQTYGAFNNLSNYPETANHEGPSIPVRRAALLMWADSLGGGWSFAVSAEQPAQDFVPLSVTAANASAAGGNAVATAVAAIVGTGGATLANTQRNRMPEFGGNIRYAQEWGAVQLGGAVREVAYQLDPSNNALHAGVPQALGGTSGDSTIGFGVTVQLQLADPIGMGGRDVFNIYGGYGDGHSLYLPDFHFAGFGTAGLVNPTTGDIDTSKNWFTLVWYQHWWTETIRSMAMFGYNGHSPGNDFSAGGTFQRSTITTANLFWSPVPRVNLGLEMARITGHTKSNLDSDAVEMQFTSVFLF